MTLDNQWNLFGLDLKKIPQIWTAGWNELLWAPGSYCRRWFDEPVMACFLADDKKQYYLAGQKVNARKARTESVVLPEELVLVTSLDLPVSVELDLESMLALEVRSKSPFLEEETRYGWRIESRDDERLIVNLVIVSTQIVMAHLQDHNYFLKKSAEIWAMVSGQPVVIAGFGESARDQRYRRSTKRAIGGLLYSFAMVSVFIGVLMLFKHWQLQDLNTQYEQAQQNAAESMALRTRLSQYNHQVTNINDQFAKSIDPYSKISKLTGLLGDDAWLDMIDFKRDKVKLTGHAADASALMELLSKQPEFKEVVALSAISQGRGGKGERFVLEIKLHNKGEPQ